VLAKFLVEFPPNIGQSSAMAIADPRLQPTPMANANVELRNLARLRCRTEENPEPKVFALKTG